MAQMSRDSPKEMMAVLIQAGDFVVTRDWARLHCLPPDLMMVRLLLLLLLHNSVETSIISGILSVKISCVYRGIFRLHINC